MKYKIKASLNIFLLLFSLSNFSQNEKTLLFIGTYTQGLPDSGIYVCEFNSKSGEIKLKSHGHNLVNPSFLNLSTNGQFLYACTNSKMPTQGKVASFAIDSSKVDIQSIHSNSSWGENPVYVSANKNNEFLVNVNYTEGNLSVYKISINGVLSEVVQTFQFEGSSIVSSRQEKSHPHAAVFSPDEKFVIVPDLGADKIRIFKFSPDQTKPLTEHKIISCIPGSGPRHFTFHSNGIYGYCIEELSGYISAFKYNNGNLDSIQRIFSYSKKQSDYAGADIHVSPDGLFLYASNRIENTISIFSINQQTGQLNAIGHTSTNGDHPRNFCIDPSGAFLLVANLGSNNIVVFKRDVKTGLLIKTKFGLKVPRPSSLQMRNYRN